MRRKCCLFLVITAFTIAAAAQDPPSAMVTGAINTVAKAGSDVDLNKWKGSNAQHAEVDGNLASIQKDLQTTLPPLLAASDGAPTSAAAALPLLLNLDALYNVLQRVAIAARSGAPHDQMIELDQAAVTLDHARRDLGDRILAMTAATEKRVSTLQATVQQQAAALQAAQAAPPPAAAPATKPKPKKKATTKPAPAQ